MTNFTDILSIPFDDIKSPQALPTGTYLCLIDSHEIGPKGKNSTLCVTFSLKPVQAQTDVDPILLQNVLDGSSLADKKIRHTLWLTNDAAFRAKQFLADHCGIPKASLREMISQAEGKPVLVTIGHRIDENSKQVFMDVKATAKANE